MRLLNGYPNKSVRDMYKPRGVQILLPRGCAASTLNLAKSAVRRWVVGSEEQWVPVHLFSSSDNKSSRALNFLRSANQLLNLKI